MSSTGDSPSIGDLAGAAALAVSVAGGWLYVAGWAYAYDYFDAFRIPLLLANLPVEHLLVYGALTITKTPIFSSLTAAALVSAIGAGWWLRNRIKRSGLFAMTAIATLVMFWLAQVLGSATAAADFDAQRGDDYPAYPRVVVTLKTSAEARAGTTALEAGCTRLLLATGAHVFLITPRQGLPALELHTIVIPWGEIERLTMSGRYESCP